MQKVIITGANGFIGSAVTNFISSKNIYVYAVVRNEESDIKRINKNKNVEVVYCDLEEIYRIYDRVEDVDAFYHFAWEGVSNANRNSYETQIKNIEYTCKCVELCKKIKCKEFIFASSLWEYECYEVMRGLDNVKLSSIYSSAKISANFMARALSNEYGIRYNNGIITNVYGIGEVSNRLINSTIRKLLNGEETKFTSASQIYDFIYIDDAAKAFYYIGKLGVNNKSYYIGSLNPKPLREYLVLLKDCIDINIELGIGKIEQSGIHLDYSIFDINSIKRDTGFEPTITFEEGIRRTIKWIEAKEGYK